MSQFRGAKRVEIPEFPKTSERRSISVDPAPLLTRVRFLLGIPYLNKFRRLEGKLDGDTAEKEAKEIDMSRKDKSKQEASRESRAVLQQYLVDLIRAVVGLKVVLSACLSPTKYPHFLDVPFRSQSSVSVLRTVIPHPGPCSSRRFPRQGRLPSYPGQQREQTSQSAGSTSLKLETRP